MAAMNETSNAMFKAALGAFRAADAIRAAVPMLRDIAVGESVGFNRVDLRNSRNFLAAFTRTDQSVGMNEIDRMLGEAYRRVLSPVSGLKLPGYGPMEDLITIAPFLRRRV